MSNKKSEYSEISARVISVFDYFKKELGVNNKDLLKKAELSHSFVSSIKNKQVNNPNSEMISRLINATGVNGHWLLTGSGKMFPDDPDYLMAQEAGEEYRAFDRALKLIGRIEQTSDEVKDIELPPGIELQLAELLVKLLKQRKYN